MSLTTLVAPAGEPVSVDAGKAFLRIAHEHENDIVADLLAAGRAYVELVTGLRLMNRTFGWRLSGWPEDFETGAFELPIGPAQNLLSIKVDDVDVTDRFWLEAGIWPTVRLKAGQGWPIVQDVIEIQFVAGFGDAQANMPADLVQAIKLHAALAYQGETAEASKRAQLFDLLAPWRRVSL